jgi:transposase-like protein
MTRGVRPSPEARELAMQLLRKDAGVYDISRRVGISPDTLYKWAKREGITLTPRRDSREGRCEVENCASPVLAKRLCRMHYQRMTQHGTTDDTRATVEERFWAKVVLDSTDCGLWTGSRIKSAEGRYYGAFRALGETLAHRVAHLLFVGPIPDGYQVDHLCSVTLCVLPAHLEAVPPEENVRRTWERGRGRVDKRFNSTNTLEYMEWVTAV